MLGIAKTMHHAHSQFTRGDMSLQHIPGTCTRNIFVCVQMLWFCPCYMSPLHVPATCRLSVYCTSFLSLQHVAATCPCNMTLVSAHLKKALCCMYCFLYTNVCGPAVNDHLCNIPVSLIKWLVTHLWLALTERTTHNIFLLNVNLQKSPDYGKPIVEKLKNRFLSIQCIFLFNSMDIQLNGFSMQCVFNSMDIQFNAYSIQRIFNSMHIQFNAYSI